MRLEPLCMSPSLCSLLCTLSNDGSLEPEISSLTVLPSWLGDALIPMLPTGTHLVTILARSCAVSACTRSSVAGLAYLCCFCFLLLIPTMLPLHSACWHGRCTCTSFVPE